MNSHLAARANYPADRWGRYNETTRRNESAGLAARRLTRRASLMLALVLSLALWAAIGTAIGWLASVLVG
jgi:Na+(H+)/acetate symporter ActP